MRPTKMHRQRRRHLHSRLQPTIKSMNRRWDYTYSDLSRSASIRTTEQAISTRTRSWDSSSLTSSWGSHSQAECPHWTPSPPYHMSSHHLSQWWKAYRHQTMRTFMRHSQVWSDPTMLFRVKLSQLRVYHRSTRRLVWTLRIICRCLTRSTCKRDQNKETR